MKRWIILIFFNLTILNPLSAKEKADSIGPGQENYKIKYDQKYRKEKIKELKEERENLREKLEALGFIVNIDATGNISYNFATDYQKDRQKEIYNELTRDKKYFQKNLRENYKDQIKQIENRIKTAKTESEHQDLLKKKKEIRKEYNKIRKNLDQENIQNKINNEISTARIILGKLSPNGITFVTNGTRIQKTVSPKKYFFDEAKEADSYKFTQEFGSLFKTKNSYFLHWEGENNDKARKTAAKKFILLIEKEIRKNANKTQRKKREIPINLVGHSHGGNIMLLVANQLLKQGYSVQFLLTLNTPVREYQLLPEYHSLPHIQLFSFDDTIQTMGGWDFDFLWQDLDYHGPAGRKFKNAINININYFLDYETYSFYKEDFLSVHANSSVYYHQITRYLGIIEKILTTPKDVRENL